MLRDISGAPDMGEPGDRHGTLLVTMDECSKLMRLVATDSEDLRSSFRVETCYGRTAHEWYLEAERLRGAATKYLQAREAYSAATGYHGPPPEYTDTRTNMIDALKKMRAAIDG